MYAAGNRLGRTTREMSGVGESENPISADLRAAREGDTAAMERLLLPHESMLLSLCLGLLGDRADAEDAVQETFLRALRGLHRYRGEAKFSTYLAQIAVHVCADHRRKRRPTLRLEDWEQATPGAPPIETSPGTEQTVINRLAALTALQTLKPQRRTALILREREQWSMEEIGNALGWSVSRVKVELFRARTALADWFRREENG